MAERGADSFKEELREVIREELQNPANRNFDDVVRALWENWNVETRVAGNTISYRHPEYKDKNNNLVSVRGSKLGELYTRKGIEYEYSKKSVVRQSEQRTDTDSRTTAEGVNPANGIEPIMGANSLNQGAEHRGQREQVPNNPAVRNTGQNLRSVDSFYERYRKPIKDDEREPVKDLEPPKRVRSKGAR